MAYKVYSTVSGRRFMTDLSDAHARGYVPQLPCYNSVFNYFESEVLTPYLLMLIEESNPPLAAIEEDFAVDSSGIGTSRFVRFHPASRNLFSSKLYGSLNWCLTETVSNIGMPLPPSVANASHLLLTL